MPAPYSADVGEKSCPRCGRQFTLTYGDDRCPDDGTLLLLPATDPLIGNTLLGKFEVLALIGSGGWGLVYKVRHLGLKKDIVLKVLHSHLIKNRDTVTRFQREAEAASHLTHTGIVFVSDYGVLDDGRPYMAMEYLAGQSLSDMIGMRGYLHWQRVVPLFIQVSDALGYAHRKGVLHRDLKPSNIFVSHADGIEQVKILDFGLAKFVGEDHPNESLTATGTAIGTPAYMSPEQCRGLPLDGRSDIYSFGYLMYEALTGTKAFSVSGLYEIMRAHTEEVPPSFSSLNRGLDVPLALETVVMRCLAKEPEDRFASAEELAQALRMVAAVEEQSQSRSHVSSGYSRRATHSEPQLESSRTKATPIVPIVIGVMTVSVLAAAGLTYLYLNLQQTKDAELANPKVVSAAGASANKKHVTSSTGPSATHPVTLATEFKAINSDKGTTPGVSSGGLSSSGSALSTTSFDSPMPQTIPNATNAETERLKSQVKLLEQKLQDQQQQLNAATAKPQQLVVAQLPAASSPMQAVRTLTAGQRGTVRRSKKMLPHDLGRHIRDWSTPEEIVQRCENWLRRNGYNYYVEDYLRSVLMEVGDTNAAMFYINDILKHSIMDDFQLEVLAGGKTQSSPGAALAQLEYNATTYKQYKYLRAACLIRQGQLFRSMGKTSEAKRCFYTVASSTDPQLLRYVHVAMSM